MITAQDKLDLIRMAGLVGRHREALSAFEAERMKTGASQDGPRR